MHSIHPLPLINRVEQLNPIVAPLKNRHAPVDKILARVYLPKQIDSEMGQFVSARSVLRFLAIAAHDSDIDDLVWHSAIGSDITRLGAWGESVSRCQTLGESIGQFCESYSRGVTFVDLGLSIEHDYAWFWRRRHLPSTDPEAERQGEQYTLAAMIHVVRQVAGERWHPPAIRLDSASPDWLLRVPGLQDARLNLNHSALALAVPFDLLKLQLPRRHPARSSAASQHPCSITPDDFLGTLHAAMASIPSRLPLSLEMGAEIAGTGPRTLRRLLRKEGTTWRRVVDRVRCERAVDLLQNSALTIADIAFELGYSDHAHFSRAFRRWTRESPLRLSYPTSHYEFQLLIRCRRRGVPAKIRRGRFREHGVAPRDAESSGAGTTSAPSRRAF